MDPKDLKDHAIEILKMKYEVHCRNLEWRENYNATLLSGFVTLNLALGGWLSKSPLSGWPRKSAFTLFVAALTWAVVMLIHRNYVRRKGVVASIRGINRALKFREAGIYMEEPLDAPKLEGGVPEIYWERFYLTAILVIAAAQLVMIWCT